MEEKSDYQKRRYLQKKQMKKVKKRNRTNQGETETDKLKKELDKLVPAEPQNNDEEVEYIEEDDYLLTGQYYEQFKNVFLAFQQKAKRQLNQGNEQSDKEQDDVESKDETPLSIYQQRKLLKAQGKLETVSRKKRKQDRWLKVAQLKALVKRPDLVEAWDITAPEPLLLVHLKGIKNSVPVPRHWCQKRKFLQNKRGMMKRIFQLPDYIAATGISKLRDPFTDHDAAKMIRQKLKERMNPKLGKIDIDYEILHDAFFKYQTKSRLTSFGDIYFEGKEEEVKSNLYRPGRISEPLRNALAMTGNSPPPWLINMQKFGPPPAYPHLRIIGKIDMILGINYSESLNFGSYFANKFEEPPKHILQPGVYATFKTTFDDEEAPLAIDRSFLWGQMVEEEIADEPQVDEQEDSWNEPYKDSLLNYAVDFDTDTKHSGISSVISGFQTPDIDLREKQTDETSIGSDKPLYQILGKKDEPMAAGQLFGGPTYIMPSDKDSTN